MKKTKSQNRPPAAQLEAVERCLRAGELEAAAQKLQRLEAAYPGFKPLKRLAYHIAWISQRDLEAVFLAWEWCEATPNSTQAFAALKESSEQEFPFLHFYAMQKMEALDGKSAAEIDQALAARKQDLLELMLEDISFEAAIKLELGRVFMGNLQSARARALLADVRCASAQNNLGQCFFTEGDIEQAAAVWSQVLVDWPDNCYALTRLVAARFWLGGRAAVNDLTGRLLNAKIENLDNASHLVEALILLGLLDEAETLFQTGFTRFVDGVEETDPSVDQVFREKIIHAGVFLAWHRGDIDEAMRRIDLSGGERLQKLRMQLLTCQMRADVPDFSLGETIQWWPIEYLRPLLEKKMNSDEEIFQYWKKSLPHVDYLAALALCGGRQTNILTYIVLRHLALGESAQRDAARAAMIELLRQPCGPDTVRSELHQWLRNHDLVDKDAAQTLWLAGQLTEAKPLDITIKDDVMEEELVLSPADQKLYSRLLDLVGEGRVSKALPLAETLYQRYPDYPRVMIFLATLREAEKQALEAWAPLVRQAFELDPDYFFARTAMCKLLVSEGLVEAARELLTPLLAIKELHSSEWRSLILAQIAIAKADDNTSALIRLNDMLRECQERFS